MSLLTEGKHPGEFIAAEANGDLSRDLITLATTGGMVIGSTVLGQVTATGKYVAVAPAANDGSQTASAILYANTNTTAGDVTNAVAVTRECTVNAGELNWGALTINQIAAAQLQLASKNIICRAAV